MRAMERKGEVRDRLTEKEGKIKVERESEGQTERQIDTLR